jgi:hypothetical protein
MNQPVHPDSGTGPELHTPTIVFEGYIGEMNDEKVVIFPRLDRRYSIEIRRKDVLDFEAGLTNGACRFVVSADAPVQERITVLTTARRARAAADISLRAALVEADESEFHEWVHEADWERPD